MFGFGKNKSQPISVREFSPAEKGILKIDDPKFSITIEEANAIANGDFSKKPEPEPEEKKVKKSNKLPINKYILYGLVGVVSLVAIVWFIKYAKNRRLLSSVNNKTQNGKKSNISYSKI